MERLQQLGSSRMAEACSTWLTDVIADLQQHLPSLLAGCHTATQLTQLEAAVLAGLSDWHKPLITLAATGADFACVALSTWELSHP